MSIASYEPSSRTRRVFARLVLFAAGVALASIIASFAGRFDERLDLFAHLRLAWIEVCLVLLACAGLARSRVAAALLLLAIVLAATPIVGLYFGRESVAAVGEPLRLLLFNVRRSNPRIAEVVSYVRDAAPDLVVFQEVTPEFDRALRESGAYERIVHEMRPDPLSAALYRRVDSDVSIRDSAVLRADDSPVAIAFLRADCEWHGHPFQLIVPRILPPTHGAAVRALRRVHYQFLRDRVQEAGACIVLGDLNSTPFSSDFRALLAQTDLRDSAQGFGYQPSWPSYGLAQLAPIPIDHALLSREFITVDRHVHRDALGSDHFPVRVDLVWRDE